MSRREMPPPPDKPLKSDCGDCGGSGQKLNGAGKLYECPTCKGSGKK